MSTLFNYREFIQLTKKGKVNYEKLTLPKNTLIANTPEQPSDFVYLIVEGFVISSLAQKPSDVWTGYTELDRKNKVCTIKEKHTGGIEDDKKSEANVHTRIQETNGGII